MYAAFATSYAATMRSRAASSHEVCPRPWEQLAPDMQTPASATAHPRGMPSRYSGAAAPALCPLSSPSDRRRRQRHLRRPRRRPRTRRRDRRAHLRTVHPRRVRPPTRGPGGHGASAPALHHHRRATEHARRSAPNWDTQHHNAANTHVSDAVRQTRRGSHHGAGQRRPLGCAPARS